MKKMYEAPSVEVVKFQYRDQVVAASGQSCISKWSNNGPTNCEDTPVWVEQVN